MANKEIRIHIAVDSDVAKVREMNTELARMAMAVGRKNDDLRQATLRAAREYYGLADAAEKCASRSVLSARQIEEAWRKAMSRPAAAASAAGGKFKALEGVAKGALKGIGGAFSSLGEMLLQGGVWAAAAEVVTRAFSWAWNKIKEDAEKAAKRAARAFAEGLDGIRESAADVEKAFASSMSGIDKAISRFDAMTNSVKELTKAEIELAKQHAIANGMDAASANVAAADLSAQVDDEAEERRLRSVIAMEQKRVDAAKSAEAATAEEKRKAAESVAAAEAEYRGKRERASEKARVAEISSLGGYAVGPVAEQVISMAKARGAAEFDESDEGAAAREKIRKAKDVLDGIKTDEKALAAADEARARIENAETALDALAARREARELAVQNELAAKEEESRREREAQDAAAAEKRAEEEKRAAEKAAAERARLDAQETARRARERQTELAARIKDHQTLLAAERAEESKTRAAASAAESKLQRAWGWYRDKDSMAAQLAEEKADAEARRQFEKDFDRLKGRRRDWRTAENLSVDDEAVRRVALAREEKEAAERHLAEIEKNTADLAAKIDELLQAKG